MFEYILDKQIKDPQSTVRLVKRLWETLPAEEQAARYDMAVAIYPEDNVNGRQNLICAQLLLEYIASEASLARDLDLEFAITNPAGHEKTT